MTRGTLHSLRIAGAVAILLFIVLPLRAIVRAPDRIATIGSLQVDAAAYDAIAAEIARTGSIGAIPPLQPPGFVLIMGGVYTIAGHSWIAAKVFLWMMFVACVGLGARLAWLVYSDEVAAWTAALLTAASPAMHGYVGTVQYEVVAATFILLLILLADYNSRATAMAATVRRAVALGLLAGAAVLTREVLIVGVPLLALWVGHRADVIKRGLVGGAIVLAGAGAFVLGWSAVQSARADRVVAVSDKGPLVLAFGNNPYANGTFNAPLSGVGEPSGFAFMRAEPLQTTRLAVRKVLYFWGVLRDGWNVPRRSALWAARATAGLVPLEWWLVVARGGAILAALLVALTFWPRELWRRWWVLPAVVAGVLSIHIITVSSHRFAVPILPLTFVIVARPIVRAMAWAFAQRTRAAVLIAVVVFVMVMQVVPSRLTYTLRAAEMDGANAANVDDENDGPIRFAAATNGPRAVLLLGDEYLPRGRFDLTISSRLKAAPQRDGAVARVWLRTASGVPVCEREIDSNELSAAWSDVRVSCALDADTIATLAVESTGTADLDFRTVMLAW